MGKLNVANRTLFTCDNLPVMQGINSETIDLIYLDPPFNSKRNNVASVGSQAAAFSEHRDRKEERCFMRYFSFIFCGLLLYIFLGCGDPVEKQINEINRIKLLHEEIAKIIRQQETNIKTETLKLKDYVDLVEPALTRQMSTIESFERAIATCQRAIKTGTNPPEWITWNNDRLQYERILNMELSQDDWDSADITRSYLKSLKTQEPLSLKKCRDYLPTAKESLATHRRDLEMGTKELKQRRDSFTKQVDKMMKDLAKAQAAFDSLNTMHTEAVFALSKLKK